MNDVDYTNYRKEFRGEVVQKTGWLVDSVAGKESNDESARMEVLRDMMISIWDAMLRLVENIERDFSEKHSPGGDDGN